MEKYSFLIPYVWGSVRDDDGSQFVLPFTKTPADSRGPIGLLPLCQMVEGTVAHEHQGSLAAEEQDTQAQVGVLKEGW